MLSEVYAPLQIRIETAQPTMSLDNNLRYLLIFLALVTLIALISKICQYFQRLGLQEKREAEEKAQWRQFEKAVSILLMERGVVCELCLSNWKKIYNLQESLERYARDHFEKAQFETENLDKLRRHVSQYHPSQMNSTVQQAGQWGSSNLWDSGIPQHVSMFNRSQHVSVFNQSQIATELAYLVKRTPPQLVE